MAEWTYKREESDAFEVIPEGDHRVRINSAEMAVAKSGNQMIVLKLDVSGYSSMLWYYIVFIPDKPEVTNRNLTRFYDSFKGIPEGDNHLDKWAGQTGAAQVKHEEYNGKTQAKVNYFIKAEKAADLPAWVEPKRAVKKESLPTDSNGFVNVPQNIEEQIPF